MEMIHHLCVNLEVYGSLHSHGMDTFVDSYLIFVEFYDRMELRSQFSLPAIRVDPQAESVHELALGIHPVVNLLL